MPTAVSATETTPRPDAVLGRLVGCGGDPTTWGGPEQWWRATHTPDGPGSVVVRWCGDSLDAQGYGPGGEWLVDRVPAMLGRLDRPRPLHPALGAEPRAASVVADAERRVGSVVFGRTETPYHDLLPIILAQRITAGEAARQWIRLCRALGTPAPGPCAGLLLPPHPDTLARRPAWWFHPLGIETARARTLTVVARHADGLARLNPDEPDGAQRWMLHLAGVGPWTVAGVAQRSFGDADAVITGDYWLPHLVVNALTGRPRGSDQEMLDLVAPWAPQRARLIALLSRAGHRVARFAAGRRIMPIEQW